MNAPDFSLAPHSIEAEQSVIGALLLDNDAFSKIADIISDCSFFRDDHRRIFRHICELLRNGQAADVVTVAESITRGNELDQTGGLAYLGEIANNTPSAANIAHYAEIIRSKEAERRALDAIAAFRCATSPISTRAAALGETMQRIAAAATRRGLPDAMRFSDIAESDSIQFDFALPGLRCGNVGILAGHGGIGKGYTALAMSIDVSLGQGVFSGFDIARPGRVLFMSIEDDQEALHARIQAVNQYLSMRNRDVLDTNLRIVSVYGRPAWQLLVRNDRTLERNASAFSAICEAGEGARLIVLDTARKFFQYDENRSDEASLVLLTADEIALRTGAAILLVHHLSKPAGGAADEMPSVFDIRGSSALVADARWAAVLAKPSAKWAQDHGLHPDERSRYRVLNVGKVNHAGEPASTLLRQDHRGVLKFESARVIPPKTDVVERTARSGRTWK